MWKKIYSSFFSEKMSIKEKLFRIILVVGIIAVTFAIIQGMTLINADELMVVYIIMLICFLVAFLMTFKYHNTNFSAILIGIVILGIAIPEIFLQGGGVNSGTTIWMCMGIFYVFLMFTGKQLLIALCLTVLVDISCFVWAYYNPESVVELSTRFEVYFDSAFAVILVGITTGIIMLFQNNLFERERKLNEEQTEKLESLSKSKDTFFAGMSHEIRTPLNAIVGLNELILREEPSENIQGYAKSIQSSSKMLLSLINDILDLSQLEVKRMELVEKEYSVAEMVHEIMDMMETRIAQKNLQFVIDIDKKCPSVLYGDERRIKQVLINLLTNAIKYTNEGTVTLRVNFEVLPVEEEKDAQIQLKIAVADTGIGIRKEEIEYLFDAFQRADLRKNHKIEGTGLGLSITKQLMDLMGGTITVDSVYTQGSIFTISLKQTVVNDEPVGEVVDNNEDVKTGAYYSKSFEAPEARVLVVDDDELNLIITTKLLEGTRMAIDTACTPEEALRKTKKRFYNLIFMDFMMPGMDGAQMLEEIRHQDNGLCKKSAIVLLSANVMGENQMDYSMMGFDGFLEKPIDVQKLEEEAMRHIPEDLIEYRSDIGTKIKGNHFVTGFMTKKPKKICVTTDSVCDLSVDLCEKMDIKMIDLYIKTDTGRFRDSTEIDINNISNYISANNSTAYSIAPSVADYEKFFAQMLTEAEDVIYISMAKNSGKCYENAVVAARGFDHVHVIDSGHISSGQALVVMYVAQMAREGASLYHIAEKVEIVKHKIRSTQMIPGAQILYKKGFINALAVKVCDFLRLHPILGTVNSKVTIIGVAYGRLEKVWRSYVRYHLRNTKRINSDIIYIVHAGLTVRQQEIILDEVRRQMKFNTVMMAQASVSNVCNAGLLSVGFSTYKK